jgi:nitroreductase
MLDSILKRKSIRQYTTEPVPEYMIEQLLEAAMSAPSSQNQRPWHFIVITERELLTMLSDISPYAKMVKDAPVAILVCGDPEREISKGFWVQDCSAATENILIAVEELNLGAVWVGIYPRETRVDYVRNVLHLPGHIVPFALIPVGYPDEEKETPNRYDKTRVHYNWWGERRST